MQRIFGAGVDCDCVQIFRKSYFPCGLQPRNVAMAPNGHLYFHPESPLYREDFALQSDLGLTGLFVHEMAHVWQHQNGQAVKYKAGLVLLTRRNPYAYRLVPGKALHRYNLEQQAEIIRDYFYLALHPDYARAMLPEATPASYEQTLAAFLDDPRYLRHQKKTPGAWLRGRKGHSR